MLAYESRTHTHTQIHKAFLEATELFLCRFVFALYSLRCNNATNRLTAVHIVAHVGGSLTQRDSTILSPVSPATCTRRHATRGEFRHPRAAIVQRGPLDKRSFPPPLSRSWHKLPRRSHDSRPRRISREISRDFRTDEFISVGPHPTRKCDLYCTVRNVITSFLCT